MSEIIVMCLLSVLFMELFLFLYWYEYKYSFDIYNNSRSIKNKSSFFEFCWSMGRIISLVSALNFGKY